ncbi:MAG: ABC transporter permease [Betaproteobacteria bacterium]|nr:ABC transporter permease [Betaproteobacteria bacterium]
MWARILALVWKELLTLLKDPRARFVLIVPPIVQLVVFGYAATYDLKHVPYALYDEDRGADARRLAAMFRGSERFREVEEIASANEVAPAIDGRRALVVLHIGPQFERELRSGKGAPLQVIVDGRNSNTALIAFNYVRSVVERFNDEWTAEHGLPPPPVRLETRAWFNANLDSSWFFLPGLVGVLTLLITMLVSALSVAREREQGTFDQLLVTPLGPAEILVGKALPGFLIGLAEASAITAIAILWFRVPMLGSVATLYGGLALFLLSAIGVGLMISSLAVTQQQGLLGAFLFMVPAMLLSGFATPIANMPAPVQWITYLDPLRYFLVILRRLFLEGAPFSILAPQFWPMALIGAASLALAGWMFRHRMY